MQTIRFGSQLMRRSEDGFVGRIKADELAWQELPFSSGRKKAVISKNVLNGYREVIEGHGGNADALLDEIGLDLTQLGDKILFNDFATLLEVSAATVNCPQFGMELGSRQDWPKLVGQLELLLKSATTFADMVDYYTHHKHVYSSAVQMHLQRCPHSERAVLRFELLADDVALRRQVMEFLLSVSHHSKYRLFQGKVRSCEVWFSHSQIASANEYKKIFGTEVHFGKPFNAIFFKADDIKCSPVFSDISVAEKEVKRLAVDYPYRSQFWPRVKDVINRTIFQSNCSREAVASELGLHPRTLHRRLKREGVTFETIKDQVRRDLAYYYLAQSDLPITEVAARLGYAELAVLTRACHRWFGTCPRTVRNQLTSEAATVSVESAH